MDYELKNKLVKIISKNILTPVIYMIENDNLLDFICFCDRNIKTVREVLLFPDRVYIFTLRFFL